MNTKALIILCISLSTANASAMWRLTPATIGQRVFDMVAPFRTLVRTGPHGEKYYHQTGERSYVRATILASIATFSAVVHHVEKNSPHPTHKPTILQSVASKIKGAHESN